MSIRDAIRRWLGVPTREGIREQILREIDADAVWREGATEAPFKARRHRDADRRSAIMFGKREDTRV